MGEAPKSGQLAWSLLPAMVHQSSHLLASLLTRDLDVVLHAIRDFDTALATIRNTATVRARCKSHCTRYSRVANFIKLQLHQTDCIPQQAAMR